MNMLWVNAGRELSAAQPGKTEIPDCNLPHDFDTVEDSNTMPQVDFLLVSFSIQLADGFGSYFGKS